VIFDPAEFAAVRFTVLNPELVYWCCGFCNSLYTPSPKDQFHEVGVLLDTSVKNTVSGTLPVVGLP
jgi:hypothetical protein